MRYILLLVSVFLTVSLSSGCEDETISPCKGVDCANGSTCNDGNCDCPRGYEGRECRQEITPSTITASQVRVSDYPLVREDGSDLDPQSNPDIFFSYMTSLNAVTRTKSLENVGGETLTFDSTVSAGFYVNFADPTSQYKFFITDSDQSGSQVIDQVEFTPYQRGEDFPTTVTFIGDRNTKFELELSYSFDSQ